MSLQDSHDRFRSSVVEVFQDGYFTVGQVSCESGVSENILYHLIEGHPYGRQAERDLVDYFTRHREMRPLLSFVPDEIRPFLQILVMGSRLELNGSFADEAEAIAIALGRALDGSEKPKRRLRAAKKLVDQSIQLDRELNLLLK